MASPRREIVDTRVAGTYHCWSRCVRRAFLCGFDKLSGRTFEHRRAWAEERLRHLSELFAISVLAYSIMENHNHLVLKTNPQKASQWTELEVALRWFRLFPKRDMAGFTREPSEQEINRFTANAKRVEDCRARLCDLSWFMRCFKENIARRANAEDEVTGAFWEGRFKCTRLDNPQAILACMVYVDLNPVRAGIAATPEESSYTSVKARVEREVTSDSARVETSSLPPAFLTPIESIFTKEAGLKLSVREYLVLVDESGKSLLEGKRGAISDKLAPILQRLSLRTEGWNMSTRMFSRLFPRVAGTREQLRQAALSAGKQWFQGVRVAEQLF